jgi:hypothetical protein
MYCSQCATEVPERAKYCPNCAAPQSSVSPRAEDTGPKPRSIGRKIFILILLLFLCFLGNVWYSQNYDITTPLLEKASVINPGEYVFIRFAVAGGAKNIRVDGRFQASGGSGNDVEVFIVDENGLLNFKNDHSVSTYYNSGKVTADTLNVQLPPAAAPVTYYLVLSNTFSLLSDKIVNGNITLHYDR